MKTITETIQSLRTRIHAFMHPTIHESGSDEVAAFGLAARARRHHRTGATRQRVSAIHVGVRLHLDLAETASAIPFRFVEANGHSARRAQIEPNGRTFQPSCLDVCDTAGLDNLPHDENLGLQNSSGPNNFWRVSNIIGILLWRIS